MQKAGEIIALIAGIFALFAAGATLIFGGLGSAFEAEGADTVVNFGWAGILFSFTTIILGTVSIWAKGRTPGILLIISAIMGTILGGTLVAIFMTPALIGGILTTIGAGKSSNRTNINTMKIPKSSHHTPSTPLVGLFFFLVYLYPLILYYLNQFTRQWLSLIETSCKCRNLVNNFHRIRNR